MYRNFITTLLAAKRMECEALAMLLPKEVRQATELAGRCAKAALTAATTELFKETTNDANAMQPSKQRVQKVKIG